MYGVQIAFKDFVATKGFMDSAWADPLFKHFQTFFSSVNFWNILRNTLGLSLYYLAVSFPAPIILALMINEVKNTKFKKAVSEHHLHAVLHLHGRSGGHGRPLLCEDRPCQQHPGPVRRGAHHVS